jgi:hypothetical protein
MPISTFTVKSVSPKPERRQNRHTKLWFKVWTIEREPDDSLPIGESLAGYETTQSVARGACVIGPRSWAAGDGAVERNAVVAIDRGSHLGPQGVSGMSGHTPGPWQF